MLGAGVRGWRRGVLGFTVGALVLQGCAPPELTGPTAGVAVAGPAESAAGQVVLPLSASEAVLALQRQPPTLESARKLQQYGETEAARQAFEALLGRDPTVAAPARLQLALLALDDDRPVEASGQLTSLLSDYPRAPERPAATYLLGMAARRLANVPDARARFEEYLRLGGPLTAYAHFELAETADRVGEPDRVQVEAQRALAEPASRRLKIEALERLAQTAAQRDDLATAQARWEDIWPLAATTTYRAEVLWQLASLSRRRGEVAPATARFQKLVVDYPATRRAGDALRSLNELGLADDVSDYQAGLVRFYQADYRRAIAGFDAQLAAGGTSEELAGAAYYRAVSLSRQGSEGTARTELQAVADSYPASPFAAEALFRLAWLEEGSGRFASAATTYRGLAATYPQSAPGQLALFRAGFALRRAGDYQQALAAWDDTLPRAEPRPIRSDVQGQGLNPRAAILYWSGKTLETLGRSTESRAQWDAAAAAAPDDYYGLRARAALAADDDAPLKGLDAARLAPPPADAALADWLGSYGADGATLDGELLADAAWQRGTALWAIGRRDQATWEFDDLRDRFANDPPRLYGLAVALRSLGADHVALQVARRLAPASGVASVFDLPRAVRALLYPAPYADLVVEQAGRWGVDPLLLLALTRQESAFDPRAESGARARGLTQVVASTGRDIARAVGRSSFEDDDLFKPAVSIEFGAYYLSQALRQFRGNVYPALAGYNAGPGTAATWLREPGGNDADLYAEQIPYVETATYVRRVYENYRLYRELYGR
jgi:peptidoglycan lytic transglycosylase